MKNIDKHFLAALGVFAGVILLIIILTAIERTGATP